MRHWRGDAQWAGECPGLEIRHEGQAGGLKASST